MRMIAVTLMGLVACAVLSQPVQSVTVSPDEMMAARAWTSQSFEGSGKPISSGAGLQVIENFDPVQKNGRFGKPLKIAGIKYSNGLFCHANSRISVRLPGPGMTFTAIAGVDSNEQTVGGQGSVVFIVTVAGKEVFRSAVIKEGMPGVPIKIELNGAQEFEITVSDSGNGISCDQADWADAKVQMADGTTVRISDLPMSGNYPITRIGEHPFSFVYDGKPSSEVLKTWKLDRASRKLDKARTERILNYTDPKTGLQVRCVGIEYNDYPTVEWTVYLKNNGTSDTPIIENIKALDMIVQRGHYGEYTLHYFVGSICARNDYAPVSTSLEPNMSKQIGAARGRPNNTDMSYFNLETPTKEGIIVVVGWPGQWSSNWTRDDGTGLRVTAGQELTHLTLHPGEEIRTPLIVLQFWNGDWIRAQNIWRKWMLAYNVPKPDGKLPEPELFGCSSHQLSEMMDANDKNQIEFIDRYLAEKIQIGHWWMDAGWYPFDDVGWPKTGTWEVDKKRFPNGLRAISDHAHAKGVKTILWFEPERVHPDTWLTKNHPEWILGGAKGGLLNLGNPEALKWLTDHVDKLMADEGIDLYRQDFNMDPLDYWRNNDTEDRQGITEIRHIEGYLAYWDELLRRHPHMYIDSCASGGRRNDLESMRRAIPLWRTDYRCEPIGTQSCTYGLSFWIPLSGTGAGDVDSYIFRSNMAPFTNCLFDVRSKSLDYDLLRKLTNQWRKVSPYYIGDFYPLTAYSIEDDAWMAWQFDRSDLGEGMVQAFRRENSAYAAIGFQLKGLDPDAMYSVTNMDRKGSKRMSGRQLMDGYLLIELPERPSAALITYKKMK
ncbi:MAG: alpha-galactosidase [Armatimonadota bacterium]